MSEPEDPTRPSKIEVMRALLEHAEAQVHFDARRPGIELPDRLLGSGNVRLDYGYGLVPPIPDLSVDEDGIRATLSFNRIPFATFVPWTAVFLITDFSGRGAVWREDLPPELAANVVPVEPGPMQAEHHTAAKTTERDLKPPRRFTVLDGDDGSEAASDGPDDKAPEPETPRPRPALRLVK
ncbi:MAG: ClpXP protease specificity-enhancing factor SspB [Polyangia bacterium]